MCARWLVKHTTCTSSLRYPRSNGQAERMVRTVKSLMKKCQKTNQDVHMAMLHLRATPIDAKLPAPAEIMFGRPIRTTLPSNNPYDAMQKHAENHEHLQDRRDKMKNDHDKHAGPSLLPLYIGQKVRVLDTPSKTWFPGEVAKVRKEPWSYEVMTPNGNKLHRNRSHLREMPGLTASKLSASANFAQPTRIQFDQTPKRLRFADQPDELDTGGKYKTVQERMPNLQKATSTRGKVVLNIKSCFEYQKVVLNIKSCFEYQKLF